MRLFQSLSNNQNHKILLSQFMLKITPANISYMYYLKKIHCSEQDDYVDPHRYLKIFSYLSNMILICLMTVIVMMFLVWSLFRGSLALYILVLPEKVWYVQFAADVINNIFKNKYLWEDVGYMYKIKLYCLEEEKF